MPDPGDRGHGLAGYGQEPGPDLRAGLSAGAVLVRPDGMLLPGVDEEAAWPAGGGDELGWSFGCDLSGVLAGLDLPLAGPGGGDQGQILADLEALDRAACDGGRVGPDRATEPGTPGPDANPNVGASRPGAAREPSAAGRDTGAETDRRMGDPGAGDATGQGSSDPGSDPAAGRSECADGPETLGSGVLGLVADVLPAGPGLAAWVAQCPPGQLSDADLPAVAAALRRVTSWAQAAELAVVAQIAARSAARDPHTGLGEDGRPAAVTRDAAAQAGLALTLSPGAAAWWADLALTLGWRLPATAAALSAGHIDLARARIIADATAVLDDDAARAVEGQVLAAAGGQTYGQLRAAVARAVILADPQGAEERRQATERRARVGLYPGDHHTATLTGMNLPAVHAAAAMARLTALARAMQAAGAGGGIDLLRAHAYLGLLLNTLPPIPPRPDAPPDHDPGPDPGPGPGGGGSGPGGPADGSSGDGCPDGGEAGDDSPAGSDSTGRPDPAPRGGTRRRGSGDPGTPPRPGTARSRRPSGEPGPDHSPSDDSTQDDSATGNRPPLGQPRPDGPDPGSARPSPPEGPTNRPRPPDRPGPSGRHPGERSLGPPDLGDPPDRPRPPAPPPSGSARRTEPPPGPDQARPIGPDVLGGPGSAEARGDRLPPEG
ncbi:MAG: DUF222 domain-containing protein, partial [Streptosporangiaceae bacterium]